MIELLDQWDQQLFILINGLHHPVLDSGMLIITSRYYPIPLYLLLIIAIIWKYKIKGLWVVVALVAAVLLANHLTSEIMKPMIGRLRPCRNPDLDAHIHLIVVCKSVYGMASSHASNSMALITALWLLMRRHNQYIPYLFIWVILVNYSRIYIGVHYPGDVMVGTLVGALASILVVGLYKRLDQRYAIGI